MNLDLGKFTTDPVVVEAYYNKSDYPSNDSRGGDVFSDEGALKSFDECVARSKISFVEAVGSLLNGES